MIDIAVTLSRFLHYAAVTTLAGTSFFPLYIYATAAPQRYDVILFGANGPTTVHALSWARK